MQVYNKISIYLRQTSHNRINNADRPSWFNYEKCFLNLLKTINWNIADLTIVFDGSLNGHFTEKYINLYSFNIKQINSTNLNRKTYQPDGSCKAGAICSEIMMNDNISSETILFQLENDYLFLPYWCEVVLDFYNTIPNSEYCMLSLYDHLDKYLFNKNTNDEWSQYKDLKSKMFLTQFRHWRTLPSITSSWIMTKKVFDLGYNECFYIGMSDNTTCGIMNKKGIWYASPIPGLSTHCQLPFLSPFIDWQFILNQY